MAWTAYSRIMDQYGRYTFVPMMSLAKDFRVQHAFADRGIELEDTAVTSRQSELLMLAVKHTEQYVEPIVEIGSYRGVTSKNIATATKRTMYAIDPYIGYGGWESDMNVFNENVSALENVRHLRATSGQANDKLNEPSFSLIFVDAVHDYSNSWFDFTVWGGRLRSGGLLAMHDVDDFPGTNLACRKFIKTRKDFSLWGYCPNLAVFVKK